MCGIAGYIGTHALPGSRLDECLRRMRRRGPDAQAVRTWTTPKGQTVHLLFARLSIIDLKARSNQPLKVNKKWIIFNGELYNYKELRKDLEASGVRFDTESDTEVLLRLLDRDGPAALDRCEGMWAFCVYDEADGSLLLCRDRFGEKPLYLHVADDGLYFGSEVKFLAALSARRFRPNTHQVFRYLINGYKSLYKTGSTFFEGIIEVPPATWLRVDRVPATVRPQRYWDPPLEQDPGMTYEHAVAGVRERLIRAVQLRLRADVPLAFCMSGGVDSNSIISIAARVLRYDVHGFTIVNEDRRYEEQEMVETAVKDLGIRHTSIPVKTQDFLPRLRELVRYHDAPVATISYYAHWLLMESVAAHGYRISLSGTAADELFTGYYDHHLAYLAEVRSDPETYRKSRAAWEKHVKPLTRNRNLQDADLFVHDPDFRDHIYMEANVFAEYLREPWAEPFTETRFTDNLLRNRMLNELFHEATPVILHEDDLNAMYYSIENRSPFLDRDLFEFCARIPTRHLIQDGRAKAVLRDAVQGILAEPVRTNRRKVGFNAPIRGFLDTHDPAVQAEILRDGPIYEYVRKDRIQALLDKPELSENESKFLFYFISSMMFLEEFA